jgi:hypothetical protein
MSYIERVLNGGQNNTDIIDFLEKEGFKYGTGALGEGNMYYVASGNYTVWFALCDNYISLYAEYDCGGEVGRDQFDFKEDDYNSFLAAYYNAVDWAKGFM